MLERRCVRLCIRRGANVMAAEIEIRLADAKAVAVRLAFSIPEYFLAIFGARENAGDNE